MVTVNIDISDSASDTSSSVPSTPTFREKYTPLDEHSFNSNAQFTGMIHHGNTNYGYYASTPDNASLQESIGSSSSSSTAGLRVFWNNLSYRVDGSKVNDQIINNEPSKNTEQCITTNNGGKKCRNVILNNLNGEIRSGELTAIMGPSGCGKTTLLECLAGKRQSGVSGEITFTGCKDVKLSFISQNDNLLCHLTVRESLLFASKLKNHPGNLPESKENVDSYGVFSLDIVPNEKIKSNITSNLKSNNNTTNNIITSNKNNKKKGKFDHESIVQKLLDQFGLDCCADVRVSNCSGGQLKRLSIAQELVSKPNLLILDEPTSGLDSASCYQCIELLQQLTQQRNNEDEPLAVVATIHQPSARVFNMFKKVIFLSTSGRCIYEGSPEKLLSFLSSVGLSCPAYNNPADYMLEIASGEYGKECMVKLANATSEEVRKKCFKGHQSNDEKGEETSAASALTSVVVAGNLPLTLTKMDSGSLAATSASTSSSLCSSKSSSCSSDINSLHKRMNKRKHLPFFYHIHLLFKRTFLSIIRDPMLTAIRFFSHILVAIFIGLLYGSKIGTASGCPPSSGINIDNVGNMQKHLYEDLTASGENSANLFFAAMFVMFGALFPTVLTFPTELNVFLKERSNGWYHSRTYFMAKTMADIPMQVIFPIIYGGIIYLMSGQVWSLWRFSMFNVILMLTGLAAQSHGLLVSALFSHDSNAAVFVGPMTTLPCLLFAGFFVRIKTIPSYLMIFSYISYIRFSFEALISLIYGFDRCSITPLTIPTDTSGSSGSALFKFLSVLFSPEYEDYTDGEGGLNATAIEERPVPTFSPSRGLIESIVKDFQSNNPFLGDVISGDKNNTTSYVMRQFDLTDYSLYMNIMRLVICFLVLRIAAYLFLTWKSDRKR